jgi:hypothetical protein
MQRKGLMHFPAFGVRKQMPRRDKLLWGAACVAKVQISNRIHFASHCLTSGLLGGKTVCTVRLAQVTPCLDQQGFAWPIPSILRDVFLRESFNPSSQFLQIPILRGSKISSTSNDEPSSPFRPRTKGRTSYPVA